MLKQILLLLFFSPLVLHAQFVNWAKSMGGNNSDNPNVVVTDEQGNIYTVGNFESVMDFDPGPKEFILVPGAFSGAFISKLNSKGDFVWAKAFYGRAWTKDITIDKMGNIYITGYFTGTVDFDPGANEYLVTSEIGMYICKLNKAGEFAWVKTLGDSKGGGQGSAIFIDSNYNIYATGLFSGVIDIQSKYGSLQLLSSLPVSFNNIFISKLDSSGEFIWAKSIRGNGIYNKVNEIIADQQGSCYIAGGFDQSADFNPDSSEWVEEANVYDAFLLKLNKDGNFVWAKKFGGNGNQDVCNGISMENSGKLYAIGNFSSFVKFGASTLTSKGKTDVFIMQLDTAGQVLWAKSIGGSGDDEANAVVADFKDNIYIVGSFQNTVDFDPGNGQYQLTSNGSDPYILKLNNLGQFDWVYSMFGKAVFEWASSVTIDTRGNIYTAGVIGDTSYYKLSEPSSYLVSKGKSDVFIIKQSPTSTGLNNTIFNNLDIKIYPNPTNGIFSIEGLKPNQPIELLIANVLGNTVFSCKELEQTVINLIHLDAGSYYLTLRTPSGTNHQKLILVK